MPLYLDVVNTDRDASDADRRQQTVRVIGEILPLLLAKYGERGNGRMAERRIGNDLQRRFEV
jgi:hypothetical protein